MKGIQKLIMSTEDTNTIKTNWKQILRESPEVSKRAAQKFQISKKWFGPAPELFPFKLNGYWLRLITAPDDPIGVQTFPDEKEFQETASASVDPLQEERYRKAPLIIHRYRDRALFLVSNTCPVYCRFCTRRRQVGRPPFPRQIQIMESLNYLRAHTEIRDVILSGGDPLMLSDSRIRRLLVQLRRLPQIKILRIGTRMPVTLPQRITEPLVKILRHFQPLYILTQFNHPAEMTSESRRACTLLVEHGLPVLNQSVLLKGVNDDPEVLLELMRKLVEIRVIPYYLHQLDPVRGALHFRVPVEKGREIMQYLWAHTGGMAVPTYVFDNPEAPGKIPLYPCAGQS